MKNTLIKSMLFLLLSINVNAQENDKLDYYTPKFSIGYTIGTHLGDHPSHLFAFEYSKDRKNLFKLELGYIYKDNLFDENDPEVDDYGVRIMATYLKKSSNGRLYYGGGILVRHLNIGNLGGVRNSSGGYDLTEYYVKSNLVGAYYQLSNKIKVVDRLYFSLGLRAGLGILNNSRDLGIDPDYDKPSPSYGSGILGPGALDICIIGCHLHEIGIHLYPIVDFHATVSYAIFN